MFTYQDLILNANLAASARCGLAPRLSQTCQTGSEVSADKDKEKRPIVHRKHAPPPPTHPPVLPPGLKQSRLFTNQDKRQPLNGGPWPLTWPWRGAAAAAAL